MRLLDANDAPLDPQSSALEVSHSVTNNGTLPSGFERDARSSDANDVRLEVSDAAASGNELWASIESADPRGGEPRSLLRLPLRRAHAGESFRSRFVRLVGDSVDLHAPAVQAQTLLVALRDEVRVKYEHAGGTVTGVWRVGASGNSDGPRAARLARLHVHVLRSEAEGPPVVAQDAQSALALLQTQVRVANEVWLQCNVTFGEPTELPIEVQAPPPPSLLAIGDGDGLPARGGGAVRFRADGRAIGPIGTRAGATPLESAQEIARALQAAGFSARVTENARTRFGAGASADVLVLRRDGTPAALRVLDDAPLSSDKRQTVQIGMVDLLDGLSEFDNMNAIAGTLEERAMV
ncbi:MAG TPA: hypothetical protein VHM19_09570, partial [Polyangiales bacterium]|nr:hypothetical protein [Polyangiales bacterium]